MKTSNKLIPLLFSTSSFLFSTVYAVPQVIVNDLGPHPILMLFLIALGTGILWFLGLLMSASNNSFIEIIGKLFMFFGSGCCIGSLISIPINLLLLFA